MSDLNDTMASQMTIVHCANCNVGFGLFKEHVRRLRETHETFYCPAKHSNYFPGQTEAERLQKVVDSVAKQRDQALREKEDLERAAKDKVFQAKGKTDKRKKCPHCGKLFTGLNIHIARAHPGK